MADAAPDAALLDLALVRARALVTRAASVAVSLADLDLPEPARPEGEAAQLRAIAGLYLLREIDRAGLIEAAERLAGLGSTGRDFGDAAADIAAFWRGRRDRLAAAERRALFAGLFGAEDDDPLPGGRPVNRHFFDAMVELAESLYKLDELAGGNPTGGVAQQARVRRAARTLADGLLASASALTRVAAEDLLATTRAALAIFRKAAAQQALGARDAWAAVAAVRRLARLPARPAALHLARGRAGMTVLAWLADAALHLDRLDRPLLGLDNPVIAAAAAWLEASLRIADGASPAPGAGLLEVAAQPAEALAPGA